MKLKDILRTMYKDTCSVTEYQEYTKPNKSTGHREVTVLENLPCKLSFETLKPTNQTDSAATISQQIKLFLDNDVIIKAGSKITVNHCGRIFEYSQSGEPGIFVSHQEIVLVPFRGWA